MDNQTTNNGNDSMNSQNNTSPVDASVTETNGEHNQKTGPLIGIVLLIAVGFIGWYLIKTQTTQIPSTRETSPTTNVNSDAILSGGDNTSDIAKDLDNISTDTVVGNDINSLNQNIQSF